MGGAEVRGVGEGEVGGGWRGGRWRSEEGDGEAGGDVRARLRSWELMGDRSRSWELVGARGRHTCSQRVMATPEGTLEPTPGALLT